MEHALLEKNSLMIGVVLPELYFEMCESSYRSLFVAVDGEY